MFTFSQQIFDPGMHTYNALYEHDDFMESINTLVDLGCGSGQDLERWATATTRDDGVTPLNIRCVGVDQIDTPVDSATDDWGSTSTNSAGAVQGFDAFGDSPASVPSQPALDGKGKPKDKRRKKEKKSDVDQGSSPDSSSQSVSTDWDPFA